MNNPSYNSTTKTTIKYTHQNQPPLPHKLVLVEDSGIDQNLTKKNRLSSGNKLGKKYSHESKLGFDEQKKLCGSCKIIPRQKIVSKSHSTNFISKVQTIKKSRKCTIKVNKNTLEKEIKLFEWRSSTHFPIMKVGIVSQKSQILSKRSEVNGLIQVEVFITWEEDIKYRLEEIDTLNLINSLYILQQSLVGFQRLFNKFGHFQPHIDMIFITNLMKCKLWLNTDIWSNQPQNNSHINKKAYLRVQIFYQKIIRMLSEYFTFMFNNKMQQQTKRNVNLIEKLLYELGRKQDFIQALKFIHQFLGVYTLKINNRFLDIDEINQNKSKIFNKIQNTNRSSLKIKTLPAIPISLQVQSENEQKLIKKISLEENDYPDIQRVLNTTNRTRGFHNQEQNQNQYKQKQLSVSHNVFQFNKQQEKLNNQSAILNHKQQPHIKTLKNSTNKQCLNQVTQSNCKTIVIDKKNNTRDNKSFKRQSQVSICSKQTIVEKKNRFSMHQENINNQDKFEHVKDRLPNFTNQDFNQPQEDIDDQNIQNQPQQTDNNNNNQKYQIGLSRHQKMLADQDEYEQKVRIQIEKNVRQKNGWLLNPMFLLQTDDCAKSFQDSQPSIKAKIRDRNLSKLNRIKSSIANSIVE